MELAHESGPVSKNRLSISQEIVYPYAGLRRDSRFHRQPIKAGSFDWLAGFFSLIYGLITTVIIRGWKKISRWPSIRKADRRTVDKNI
jgi:hypothetical protein